MLPAEIVPALPVVAAEGPPSEKCRFAGLRSVKWRINLGILPPSSSSSSVDDLRRVTADARRRYACLRRRLLIDPHVSKDGTNSPDSVMDNPLSQSPDSSWDRLFRSAELEKMVDQDLSRLYPEHVNYFQTSGCQGAFRRILLLWCLRHPDYGYRQGMHELLAPLLHTLDVDIERLSQIRKLHKDHFIDKFDGLPFHENNLTYNFDLKKFPDSIECGNSMKSADELGTEVQTIVLLSDAYGAEGELGAVLSEKFMEHDAYCMFDALMSGGGGAVVMADFFSPPPVGTVLPPVLEASNALYHLISVVDSSLHSHLIELGVEPQYFALRWLRVLFGREFVLEDLLIIWDEIFAADNIKLEKGTEDDSGFRILASHRGAYISAIAVSMVLYLRCSLLATENATSCLQRLLNFPENVDLKKLIKKARTLKALALDINTSSLIPSVSRPLDRSKSSDSSPTKTPIVLNDSYWEEKWRVVHKAEELKQGGSGKPAPTRKKGWIGRVRLALFRTTSDPSKDMRSSIRQSLLVGFSRPLRIEGDDGKVGHCEVEGLNDHISVKVVERQEDDKNSTCTLEERCASGISGSEEISSIFSDPTNPLSDADENESEKIGSTLLSIDNHPQNAMEDSSHSVFNLPVEASQNSGGNNGPIGKPAAGVKEWKLLLGKFQWLWKFGRQAAGEATNSCKAEDDATGSSVSCSNHRRGKGDTVDRNVMSTLRNLGQTMLEHIQVIESVFRQTQGTKKLTNNALLGKGQSTAVVALKELRKISNLLSEM